MKTFKTISTFFILILMTTLAFAEGIQISEQEQLIQKLQQRLRINRQDAADVMKQLKKEMKSRKQNRFYLNNKSVDNILRICKHFGIQKGAVSRVMAAGNYYSDEMKKNGASKKQITRNMYMLMYREMKKNGSSKNIGNRIMKKLRAHIRTHNRIAIKSGNGNKIQNRYKNQYQNERSDHGTHGKKQVGNKK